MAFHAEFWIAVAGELMLLMRVFYIHVSADSAVSLRNGVNRKKVWSQWSRLCSFSITAVSSFWIFMPIWAKSNIPRNRKPHWQISKHSSCSRQNANNLKDWQQKSKTWKWQKESKNVLDRDWNVLDNRPKTDSCDVDRTSPSASVQCRARDRVKSSLFRYWPPTRLARRAHGLLTPSTVYSLKLICGHIDEIVFC